jgi:hypothetical protein
MALAQNVLLLIRGNYVALFVLEKKKTLSIYFSNALSHYNYGKQ